MNKGRYSTKRILLNVAIVLVGVCLGLLTSVRHAYWGPEGPVGGWLLLVPYLALVIVLVTALLVARNILMGPGRPRDALWYLGWTFDHIFSLGLLLDVRGRDTV